MANSFPTKYPDEVLDYAVDWTAKLAGDTIVSATVRAAASSLTISREGNTDTLQSFWLSGGTSGLVILTCEVVTSGSRTLAQPITIQIG